MLYTFGLEDFFRRKLILTGIILRRSLLDLKYLELILLCLAVSVFCCSDHRLSDSFLHSFVNPDADHDAGPSMQGCLLCLWMRCSAGIFTMPVNVLPWHPGSISPSKHHLPTVHLLSVWIIESEPTIHTATKNQKKTWRNPIIWKFTLNHRKHNKKTTPFKNIDNVISFLFSIIRTILAIYFFLILAILFSFSFLCITMFVGHLKCIDRFHQHSSWLYTLLKWYNK